MSRNAQRVHTEPMLRPHVTLKLATSLDGRIATAAGESRWITSSAARDEVQRMRARADAVLVGAGTVRADDPELMVRTDAGAGPQPLRVVLDTELSLSIQSRLVGTIGQAPLLVIAATDADASRRVRLEAAGAQTDAVGRGPHGVDVEAALSCLSRRGIQTVLVEGGGHLAASLIDAEVVDRLEWFRAPLILGAEGVPGIGPLGIARLMEAHRWRRIALRELGPDVWESYEPPE